MGASTAYRSSKAGSSKASAPSKPDTIYSFNQPESANGSTVFYLTQRQLDAFSERIQNSTLSPSHKAGANICTYMLSSEAPRGELSECEDAPYSILEPKPATGRMSHGVSTPASSVFGLNRPPTKTGSGMKSKKSTKRFVRFTDDSPDHEASIKALDAAWESYQSKPKKIPRARAKSSGAGTTKKSEMSTFTDTLQTLVGDIGTLLNAQRAFQAQHSQQSQDAQSQPILDDLAQNSYSNDPFSGQNNQYYDTDSEQSHGFPAPPPYAGDHATNGPAVQFHPDQIDCQGASAGYYQGHPDAFSTQPQGSWKWVPPMTQADPFMYEVPNEAYEDPGRYAVPIPTNMSYGTNGSRLGHGQPVRYVY